MKKFSVLIIPVLLAALVLTGCTRKVAPTRGTTGTKSSYTVALVPKLIGIPFFESAAEGARQAGKDIGIKVIYTGSTTADAAQQVNVIQDLIQKKVDAICVSANDPASVAPVLKRARAAGIRVVTWDSDANKDAREMFISQIDNESLGRHVMDTMADAIGKKGEYAIITGALTARNLNTWMDWMKKEQTEKYPEMKLVAVVPCDDDQQKAFVAAQNLITAYPNLKGIIGNSSAAPPGAAEAVKQANKKGKIMVVGLSTPNLMRQYIKDGIVPRITLWDVKKLGYLTIYMANDILKGNKPQTGQEVPTIGKIKVVGDTIIMGDPLDFTSSNVNQFNF